MAENNTSNSGGTHWVDFCDTTAIVLFALKIFGEIQWPWVWVLAPLWIQIIGIIVHTIVSTICEEIGRKKNN